MFISSLDITEYRGIKKCSTPIRFSKFNVLIGRNNAGKTTILETLFFLPHPSANSNNYDQEPRINKIINYHKGHLYKPLLYAFSGEANIDYIVNNKKCALKITESSYEFFIENKQITNTKDVLDILKIKENVLDDTVLYYPNRTDLIEELELQLSNLQDQIIKNGYHVSVAELLSKCVDDEYSEILFMNPIKMRKILSNGNFIYIPLKDLGDGFEKAMKLIPIIELRKPKLILFDDFETSYHPSLIRILLEWLNERDCQIILTTHSIDVLYELLDLKPKNTKVIHLQKDKDDQLLYKDLTMDDLEDLLDSSSDPRLLPSKFSI